MKHTLAFVALAIAGFTFGFAGCGEDDDGSPGGGTDTEMTEPRTTTEEDGGSDY
jgi:hypothetical protein